MRYWLSYSITIFFLTLGAFILLWFFNPVFQIQASQESVDSPVPSFLDMTKNDQVSSLSYWLPAAIPSVTMATISGITAKSALSYDLTTNQYLYVDHILQRTPMASLTKLMTAIVALEHPKQDDQYIVYPRDLVGEDSMGLSAGEKLSLEELLYGVFLHSGNDAAQTIADNAPDGIDGFVQDMNNKAKSLGLTDTHFTNPSGLEGNGNQYTNAYDLLVMARYGLVNFPLFVKTSSTVSITIPQTATHKEFDLSNETNLMTTYPGVDGLKTGYTPEAGYCLVTDLHYSGHHIIAIVLNSKDRRSDMKQLLDYSLTKLGITPPKHD